ncbi:MAG: sigma-70 family RNA polymerase sigma factor [Phycisphaerae bacterium]|nr:sigma-70 family RNA polymerase sigma factor [Phycisphaerae bacterium]
MQPETAKVNIDESVLVERCKSGDSQAFERLIIKYQNRIYNVILKICANPDDSAELTQETFVKVIENIDRFESRSRFYTWAFRIAVNLALNFCQRGLKLGLKSLDWENDENEDCKSSLKHYLADEIAADPSQIAANSELVQLVQKALMRLDDDQRSVIVLRDIESMSYAQIAEVLNIELGTVKSRLSRARNALREILESIIE